MVALRASGIRCLWLVAKSNGVDDDTLVISFSWLECKGVEELLYIGFVAIPVVNDEQDIKSTLDQVDSFIRLRAVLRDCLVLADWVAIHDQALSGKHSLLVALRQGVALRVEY